MGTVAVSGLSDISGIIAATQLQLVAEGYPPGLVSMGIERARGMATSKARGIRDEVYELAYRDMLIYELSTVKDWVERTWAAARDES